MKKRNGLIFALFAALLTAAGGVQAQLTQDDFRDATIGMMTAGSVAAKIRELHEVSSLGVVRLKRIVVFRHPGDEPDPAAIGISAQKNAAGIAQLRSALAANPATRAALANRGVPINLVVAARILGGNSLRVYLLSR
jgi:hypothetical protein